MGRIPSASPSWGHFHCCCCHTGGERGLLFPYWLLPGVSQGTLKDLCPQDSLLQVLECMGFPQSLLHLYLLVGFRVPPSLRQAVQEGQRQQPRRATAGLSLKDWVPYPVLLLRSPSQSPLTVALHVLPTIFSCGQRKQWGVLCLFHSDQNQKSSVFFHHVSISL